MVSASDFRQIAHGIDLVKSVQDIDLLKVYRSITADKIMTKNPFSIPPNTTLDDVAEIFGKEKFHAIPVIENSVLVGIISIHDVNFHKYG